MPGLDSRVSNLVQAMRRAETGGDPDGDDDEPEPKNNMSEPHDIPEPGDEPHGDIEHHGILGGVTRLYHHLFGDLSLT